MKLAKPIIGGVALLLTGGMSFAQQDQEAAAARLFADAVQQQQEGDLEGALRNFELLVQQFEDSELADDALLNAAQGHWVLRDESAARDAIERLKTDYARTPGAAGAFVLDGDIRAATSRGYGDLEEAREQFRNAVLLFGRAAFPNLDVRSLALLRAGEMSILMDEPDEAAAAFLAVIEDELHSAWTEAARLQLATVLMRQGQWAPAAEILQRIVDQDEGGASGSGPNAEVIAAARRRLELGNRLLSRPQQSQLPWNGARQVRFSGPQIKDPEGIAAAEDNRVIIVDRGVPIAAVLETDGTLSSRRQLSDAYHPWWAQDSSAAHVANKKSISMLISGTRENFQVQDGDEMKDLENIVAGARGIHRQWLVLDSDRKEVMLFDESAELLTTLIGEGSEPVDVAVDYLGRFYVLDRRSKELFRFGADGGGRISFAKRDWRRPEAVAVDGLGNVYVLDRDAKSIDVFGPQGGQPLWQIASPLPGGIEFDSPRDLSVDGSGRIYVADRSLKAYLVLE